MKYVKTYWMNLVSAVFWLVIYISLTLNHIYTSDSESLSETIAIWLTSTHAYLFALFSTTALVLATSNHGRLRKLAESLNYGVVLLILLQLCYLIRGYSPATLTNNDMAFYVTKFAICFELFIFLLPALINLRALRDN